ncbi:MAG TPA: hypothetical protein VFZ77_10570 [Acidimicrobiales bacterium]
MAGSGDADDSRLAGRTPRPARRAPDEVEDAAEDEAGPDDEEMDAVNRLLGFLRGED